MSKWVSQIRKILQDNPNNHLYLISQTERKIDVDFRELAQIIIYNIKQKIGEHIFIKQYWYEGIENYEINKCRLKTRFYANPYFKNYDYLGLVTFKDAEEFI